MFVQYMGIYNTVSCFVLSFSFHLISLLSKILIHFFVVVLMHGQLFVWLLDGSRVRGHRDPTVSSSFQPISDGMSQA